VILRIISPNNEFLEISKELVFNKNIDKNVENNIQIQYSNLLSSSAISILRFPYILDLISITSPSTIIATVNFAFVRTTLFAGSVSNAVNLIIKGSTIELGKSGGTLRIMGNTVPITSRYNSTVVSLTSNGSRIQAGTCLPVSGNTLYTYPTSFTSSSVVIVTVTQSDNSVSVGTQSPGAETVNIRTNQTSNFVDINWVAFGN
jgi:hypothetical protein